MPKRLLDYDPLTGLKTYHEYDWKEKKTLIGYEQEGLEDFFALNRRMGEQVDAKYKKRDAWHAATIPAYLIVKWKQEGIDVYNPQDYKRVARKLNDPEYAFLRTWKGRI